MTTTSGSRQPSTVLVVDDTPENLSIITELLRGLYQVKLANSGERALKLAQSDMPPDIILLDIMMPGMDGYEVCRHLKSNPRTVHIPVIFITAMTGYEDESKGLRLGAVDYVGKPINRDVLLNRIKNHLDLKLMQDFLRDRNSFLEAEIRRRTEQIVAIQDATIHALASLAGTRDNETGSHLLRTQHYVRALAEKLRWHPRFAPVLNDDLTIDLLFKSAPLHDIGKVGIPDCILLKAGKLTEEEFEIMKNHTVLGRDAIVSAERGLGIDLPFLRYAKEIAYGHQEKWDGSGYPQGLVGEDIPISARLMALADVYDALISARVYKPGLSHEAAARIILEGRGSHFDPAIVDAFEDVQEEFRMIALRYMDA
jgi:putative two-component system response regulator